DALANQGIQYPLASAMKIASIMRDRITFAKDLWEQGRFFFYPPDTFDQGVASKRWNEDAVKVVSAFRDAISAETDELTADRAKSILENVTSTLGIGTGKILQALRLSLTGAGGGPDLMMIMEIIGKTEVVKRINHAIQTLKVKVA